jgi:hypothetical protein
MNVNFGLLKGYNKRQKDAVVKNALSAISAWKDETDRLRSPLQRQED